ncbi:hypothetical protein ABW19_dt0201761 [Dactylella cylindrospora]|nr:hypothetical protein ABW19_dt0201761 [Dactylella cylindrospora]
MDFFPGREPASEISTLSSSSNPSKYANPKPPPASLSSIAPGEPPESKKQKPSVEALFSEKRPHPLQTCTICGKTPAWSCNDCHGVYYCSPSHRQQDKPTHELICDSVKGIPQRPDGENWICILVFPDHAPRPYFHWVRYSFNDYNLPAFDQTEWFGEGYRSIPSFITHHPVTRRELGTPILMFRKDLAEGGKDVVTQNLCAYNLTGGVDPDGLKGDLLFVAVGRSREKDREWFLSFLPEYLPLAIEDLKLPRHGTGKKKDGVKGLACYPTIDGNGEKVIKVFVAGVPHDHPIYAKEDFRIKQPTISENYGFPITTFFFEKTAIYGGNVVACDLFPSVEPGEKPGYVIKPCPWSSKDIGPILIARTDRKPLRSEHLELFIGFTKYLTKVWDKFNKFNAKKSKENRENKMTSASLAEEAAITVEFFKTLDNDAFRDYWDEHSVGFHCPSPFEGVKRNGGDGYAEGADEADRRLPIVRS